jgi:hypothetical protein
MNNQTSTIDVHGYKVRKFNIKEYADLSKRFKGAFGLLEKLSTDSSINTLGELIGECLPELIIAVSYATDKKVEEIEAIDDMQVFGDLVVALKEVNDFLALKAAAQNVMTKLFQSQSQEQN